MIASLHQQATDEALMELVMQGDKRAFSALLRRYRKRIFLVAYHILGSPQDADDIAQDTFLNVYRKAHTYRQEGRFFSWIHRICVNLALKSRQRQRRRRSELQEDVESMHNTFGNIVATNCEHLESPEKAVERRQMVSNVKEALARLDENQRTAFVLRVFHNLSYKEIAEAMETSIGTVQSRIARAREALRVYVRHPKQREGNQG